MKYLRWGALVIIVLAVFLGLVVVEGTVDPCIEKEPHDFGCPETNPLRGIIVVGGFFTAFVLWIIGSIFGSGE